MNRQPGRTTLNASRFRRAVARHMRTRLQPGAQIIKVASTNLGRYRFKHAVRFDITYRTRWGQVERTSVHANIPSPDRKHESRVADRVERSLKRSRLLPSPNPYGVIRELNAHVYAHLPGTPLRDLLRSHPAAAVKAAGAVGDWLSALSRLRLRVGPERHGGQFREESRYFLENYRRAAPSTVENAALVLQAAVEAEERLCRTFHREFRTTHGDLDLGNIIVGPNSTAMIDFGNSVVFDPLSDAGNFLSQIDAAVWRKRIGKNLGQKLASAFLRRYRVPSARSRRRLFIHRAWWTLQVAAYTCATEPPVGRRMLAPALARARKLLGEAGCPEPQRLSSATKKTIRQRLLDTASVSAFFQQHLQAWFPEANALTALDVRHQPALSTTSFLTRYRLTLDVDGTPQQRIVRGNFVTPKTWRLVRYVSRRARGFSVIRPLDYVKPAGYFFYEELSGQTLRNLSLQAPSYGLVLRRIGAGLAALHALPPSNLRNLTLGSERQSLRLIARNVKRFGENCLPNAQSIIRNLLSAEHQIWTRRRAIVHNDFQASNIILRPRDIGIIDFTMSGSGHPAIDVANFLAHLEVMLHLEKKPADIRRYQNDFLAGYQSIDRTARTPEFKAAIRLFQLRSYLDILSITVMNLGPRDPNRRAYVRLLTERIRHLTNTLT